MAEQDGLVTATHGRHCMVEAADGRTLLCHARGKKLEAVVGDRVRWLPSHDAGVISRILPRRNLLLRQDHNRSKRFAANLDQVLVMLAARPVFSEQLLARMLIACEAAGIRAHIVLNKADLGASFAQAWQRLQPYRDMDVPTWPLAAAEVGNDDGLAALEQALAGRVTLLAGPSGVGKSTLVNRLVPAANARTAAISRALQSGRHTTTRTNWYWLDRAAGSALIDSPGFQEFGLQHVDRRQLVQHMPDLAPHSRHCRFANCTHMHEPGCELRTWVAAAPEPAPAARYAIYRDLWQALAPRGHGRHG